MKRLLSVLGTLALWGVVPLAAQGKLPLIDFESQTKDFGKVFEGEELQHVFKFTNKGNTELEILKVEPG